MVTNPKLRVGANIEFPGLTGAAKESIIQIQELPLDADHTSSMNALAYLAGCAASMMTFVQQEIAIDIVNYDDLSEYERMRARELLVVLSTMYTGKEADHVFGLRIKVKLELNLPSPRALIYDLKEG